MMKKLTIYLWLSIAVSAFAQEKIILLNEGVWQSDNGRISYFEEGKVVSNQWFRDKNQQKLGDTPNDIIQVNDQLIAIAINWSNIIQFISPEGLAVAATEDVPNNRKLASDGRYVYVTSYGHECGNPDKGFYREFTKGFVAKIDVETFQVVDAVEVGYEPEGIAYYQGHLFVANTGGYAFQEDHEYETTVSVVRASDMQVVRTIDTGQINLYGKLSQSGQYLCINSPGDYYEVSACAIVLDCKKALGDESDCFVSLPYAATYSATALDGSFLAIGSRYSYLTSEYTFNYVTIDPALALSSQGQEGVSQTLPGSLQSDIEKMTSPYGIYVNPYTGYLYATDAASYASGGTLYQWNPEGRLLGSYKVYINPAHFLALPPDGHFTGIGECDAEVPDGAWYDLTGRRVNPTAAGHYIHHRRIIQTK